jgi:predicted nucleic acid-binding protein
LTIEVANGLRFGISDPTGAQPILAKFFEIPIHYFFLTPEQTSEIVSLSYGLSTTVYDTSYHFLARLLGATFITCDRAYYQKAKALGNIELWS